MDRLVAAYEQTYLVEDEKAGLVTYEADWSTYQVAFRDVLRAAGAGDVAGTSRQLGQAAGESAQVVNQVATAMQQMATGTQEQARAVSAATRNADEMATGIEQVATTAQSVAAAVPRRRDDDWGTHEQPRHLTAV